MIELTIKGVINAFLFALIGSTIITVVYVGIGWLLFAPKPWNKKKEEARG